VKRRVVIGMSGAAALGCALPGFAQPTPKVYRIGVLSELFPRLLVIGMLPAFGYEEGRNLLVDFKFAQGKPELLPALAAELVAAKPDLILAPLNTEAAVLKRVTSSIPILMMYVSAPVETGLIASLARPGGNLTGTTTNAPQVAGKMTQLLREAVPGSSRIAWISDPAYPGMPLYIQATERVAKAMGFRLTTLAVRTLPDLEGALAALGHDRPDALVVANTGVITAQMAHIIEFVSHAKIPTLYSTRTPVANGGLMSYGPDFAEINRRDAAMIDKILKGTKPSDIPVEEPSKFLLTLNLKAARSMGFTFPQALLLQADEVIE
jgi:putative ABC transport system substrate-binding protein